MKKIIPILILLAIEIGLFLANYRPGTYFLGWDNLFPEMNFSENIRRSFFAVWEEYRGLGLLDGMSFAANLPHYLFLWLLSFFLPQNLLRYSFFFLMHFLGGVGMYLFLSGQITRQKWSAFFGALFYQFNLATIQMFYAPYELFAVHFAFLPWLVNYLIKFLRTGENKNLVWFAIFSLLAVPQAHVPTVFLIYLILVFFILIFNFFKRILTVLVTIFMINAFWLLPYSYDVLTNTNTVLEAKINQMARFDIYANQKARGDLVNVVTLKGFLLDAKESGSFIMAPWKNYLNSPLFKIGEVTFLGLAVIGIVAIIKRREKHFYPFLAVASVAFFFLASNVPVLGALNDLLRNNIALIGEGFRFSFTKFAIVFVFAYSIFIAYGLETITKQWIFNVLALLLLLIYAFPVFQGNFFFDALRIKIPPEYFQVVDYFNDQPLDTRIANFPQVNYSSWRFTNFGYRGSGFFWYGVKQPMLDRAFDPWSRQNENYYKEISYALYSQNLPLFEEVLEKYRVNWLLLDGNIINPSSPKALYIDELKDLVKNSQQISLIRQIGQIGIYKNNLKTPTKSFVSIQEKLDLKKLVTSDQKLVTSPYYLPNLSHNQGYLITVTGKNMANKQSLFWLENLNSRRADLEERLKDGVNYFIQPPMEPDGLGYSLHIENFETEKVTIGEIEKGILEPPRMTSQGGYDDRFIVEHPNPAFYRIDLNVDKPSTLILSQSFDKGWLALGAKNHVLIDNWANGWEVDPGLRIVYLFYWPQLLEFGGFSLLTIFILALIIKKRTSSASQ
ncbi:hypothetical protein HY085_01020 [Candidatus Gottesmanbacteria bacterium]|nr:hypothetical protein [Candidatus Gottesmanbacteria bacterium]